MVIILEGAIEEVEPEINKAVEKRIKELLLQDLSTKEVAKQIAIEYKIKKMMPMPWLWVLSRYHHAATSKVKKNLFDFINQVL